MLAAQGGHHVLLDLVREVSTHPKVVIITDKILAIIVEHGLLPQDEVLRNRKVFASFNNWNICIKTEAGGDSPT